MVYTNSQTSYADLKLGDPGPGSLESPFHLMVKDIVFSLFLFTITLHTLFHQLVI